MSLKPLPKEIYERCKIGSKYVSYTVGQTKLDSYYVINPYSNKKTSSSDDIPPVNERQEHKPQTL